MLLSIIVVSASVFGILSVLGLLNGLQDQAIKNILNVSSYHVEVSFPYQKEPEDFEQDLLSYKEITTVVPYYQEETLVLTDSGEYLPVLMRAVPSNIDSYDPIFAREISYRDGTLSSGGALVGINLAYSTGINWGNQLQILSLGGKGSVLRPAMYAPSVSGIMLSSDSGMNSNYVLIPIEDRFEVFPEQSTPHFGIRLENYKDASRIQTVIQEKYPDATVYTWKELHRDFVAALELEKTVLSLLLGLLILFAGISVKHSVNRLLRGKRMELAMLKATGVDRKQITEITLGMGGVLGVTGVILGLVMGYLFLIYSNEIIAGILLLITRISGVFGGSFIPQAFYTIQYRISLVEVSSITLITLFIVLYSSWRGSRDIVKNSPLEVIKYE